MSSDSAVKLTFYPMAGGVMEQFDNLLQTLRWLDINAPTPNDVYEWLRTTFRLSHYFARNVYTVILNSGGLVTVRNGRCYLTRIGTAVLNAASPDILLNTFEKEFAGVAAVLEVLRTNNAGVEALQATWFELVKNRFPRMKNWSKVTLGNQFRHRINWLRAMGFITIMRGKYSLSENGWRFVITSPPEAIAIQQHEIKREENRLRDAALGNFQPFDLSAEKTRFLRSSFVRARAFRNVVINQYSYRCAICAFRLITPHGLHEAQAAHIIPRQLRGSDDPRNGMCLCGTHHWAFDKGVISVCAKNFSVMTATYLEEAKDDESVQRLLQLRGKHIQAVANQNYSPSVEALDWHNKQIFLG